MTGAVDVSIVLPVYNEADSLPILFAEIEQSMAGTRQSYEVVCVDDGSQDGSADIIRSFHEADPRIRLLRFRDNAGETVATDAGLRAATGCLIVTMDADLQNDPRDIPTLLSHLDRWDAVTGWRVDRHAGDSWVRHVSSRVANRVRNALSDESIRDSGCTFRAFRRECVQELVLYKGFHRFVPTLLRMRGFTVLEVPVKHRPRRVGQSKYGIGNRAWSAFKDLLAVRWMKARQVRYEVVEDVGGGAPPR
jgi:glycosyltransferase involved in cell wall biosynthesis